MRSERAEPEPDGSPTPAVTIPAKFRSPALPRDLVQRPRLVVRLTQGALRPLTLVSPPAGYGKTVLVGSWVERVGRAHTVLHTTLDESDRTAAGFWRTALQGLGGTGVDVTGLRLTPALGSKDLVSATRLAQRIAARETPLVWVLDCDEFSLPPAVGEALHTILVGCPERLRLVLLTRTDPPLPLHRHRLDGSMTEIRAHDLAFTDAEVATLLQHNGLDLPAADVRTLRTRTDGWPAGVRFAAMSLAGAEDTHRAVQEFRGDTGNVAAYLVDEVLAKQVPETRTFLLRTSVASLLEPGLVEALTGQHCDARTLEFAANGNSFVEAVPGDPGCYRYNSLFREFLRSQLAYEQPDLVPELHLTAAEWLARNGRPVAALRHAVTAGAWSAAAAHLVEDVGVGQLLLGGERTGLVELLTGLPADVDGLAPSISRAATALVGLDVDRAASELTRAREISETVGSPPSQACDLAVVVLQALADSLTPGRDTALTSALAAERALRLAATHDTARHADLRAVVAASKSRVLIRRGELEAALVALRGGIEATRHHGLDTAGAELGGMAALTQAMGGQLRLAVETATSVPPPQDDPQARPTAETASQVQAATLALAWVRTDQHDLETAEALLDRAETMASSYDATVLGTVQTLLRARLQRARGRQQLARAELRAALSTTPPGGDHEWLGHCLLVEQSASLMAEGRSADAAAVLSGTQGCSHLACDLQRRHVFPQEPGHDDALTEGPMTVEQAPLETRVEAWLTRAAEALHADDTARGERCLEHALELAAPEQLRRPFHESPTEIHRLLERSARWERLRRPPAGPHVPAQRTESSTGHPHRDDQMPVVVPLTKREQEVLGHLADLLTTDEIAQEMFVSVNTVRSHIRSIFRKLGVARRNEAVRRAWELELLPPRTAA